MKKILIASLIFASLFGAVGSANAAGTLGVFGQVSSETNGDSNLERGVRWSRLFYFYPTPVINTLVSGEVDIKNATRFFINQNGQSVSQSEIRFAAGPRVTVCRKEPAFNLIPCATSRVSVDANVNGQLRANLSAGIGFMRPGWGLNLEVQQSSSGAAGAGLNLFRTF